MARPGDTIATRLTLGSAPDAAPVVRVFRNGVRTATITLVGASTSYAINYAVPSGWLTTDFIQIIAYPIFSGITYPGVVWWDRLGAVAIRTNETAVVAAIVCGSTPDSTPTANTWLNGVASIDPSVSAGAVATEFVVTVDIDASGLNAGVLRLDSTATIGGEDFPDTVWEFEIKTEAAAPEPSEDWVEPSYWYVARRPSSANRNAGTAHAKDGDEVVLAVDVSTLLESIEGGATISLAGCSVSSSGATVGTLAVSPTGTAVGGLFTDLAVGNWIVTWVVVLSDGSRHEIPGGLVVTA